MFWGLIMEPQRRYSQKVKKSFHISMAALDISNANDEPAQIMCCYEGRNYLLCTLKKPDMIQCPLDLNFEEGSDISFASNGKSHVHLTGYLTNELDMLEEEEEEGDLEGEDEEVEVPSKKKKKQKAVAEAEPPKKKSKLTNSLLELAAEEEEDEDDEDFEVEEEESDDEEVEEEEDGGEEQSEDEESEDEQEDEEEEKPIEQPKVNGIKKEKKAQISKKKEKEPKQKDKKQQKESPKKTVKKLQAGVLVEDLKEGEGPVAKNGKYISVYYEGRLKQNNKVFDSSLTGPGFKFRLGADEVIKGWDIGLVGMKQGGKRRISCPPNAAYGAKGSPPVIPPNSTLVFEVELLKVK